MYLDHQFLTLAVPELECISSSSLSDYIFSIDSRTVQPGELFIALPGEKVDGHTFCENALRKGAAGLVIASNKKDILKKIDSNLLHNKYIVAVPDPKTALVTWATAWRQQFTIPVIGITGSVGKTSTKEITSAILTAACIKHVSSIHNQNTLLGISLNMLRLTDEHKAAIFEFGINKRGEMAQLAQLVKPTFALITSIGHCHMEGLGSLQDIAIEKRDIFKYFTEQSIGIVNGDVPLLSQVSYIHPVVKFGTKTINQIQARKIRVSDGKTDFVMKVYKQKYMVSLPHMHEGAVSNALAAATIAHMLQVPMDVIVQTIQMPLKIKGRFEERKLRQNTGTIINDCYNANPESMKAALLAFEKYDTQADKIAILGDMLELGVTTAFWHRQLGRFLRKVPSLKRLILVGSYVQSTKKTAPITLQVEIVPTWQEALVKIEEIIAQTKSVVLVKASRAMQLNSLVDALTTDVHYIQKEQARTTHVKASESSLHG